MLHCHSVWLLQCRLPLVPNSQDKSSVHKVKTEFQIVINNLEVVEVKCEWIVNSEKFKKYQQDLNELVGHLLNLPKEEEAKLSTWQSHFVGCSDVWHLICLNYRATWCHLLIEMVLAFVHLVAFWCFRRLFIRSLEVSSWNFQEVTSTRDHSFQYCGFQHVIRNFGSNSYFDHRRLSLNNLDIVQFEKIILRWIPTTVLWVISIQKEWKRWEDSGKLFLSRM